MTLIWIIDMHYNIFFTIYGMNSHLSFIYRETENSPFTKLCMDKKYLKLRFQLCYAFLNLIFTALRGVYIFYIHILQGYKKYFFHVSGYEHNQQLLTIDFYNVICFIIYLFRYFKSNVVVVRKLGFHDAGREFNSLLSEVHSTFDSFKVFKMSIELASEINTEDPELRWLPDYIGTCCIALRSPSSRKQGSAPQNFIP